MCTTSTNNGLCLASLQLPTEWFLFSDGIASADLEIRILGTDDLPINIGSLSLHPNQPVSLSNTIALVLPSQPINPGESFTVTASAHATYAVATYSITCSFSELLQVIVLNIDQEKWVSETRADNDSNIAVVSILRDADSVTFDESNDEEIFTIEMILSPNAMPDDYVTIACNVNHLSNVLNEQILPEDISILPSALIYDYNSSNDPYTGEILVGSDSAVGLVSYADQSQIINTAIFSGNRQEFVLNHFLVYSNGQLLDTSEIECESDSTAFYLSSDCMSFVLNGTEANGDSKAKITITHRNLSTQVYVRVWYPFSEALLSISPQVLSPIRDAVVMNSSGDCVQLWEKGQIELFVDYSYDSDSPSYTVSMLTHIIDHLTLSNGPAILETGGVLAPYSNGGITVSAGPNVSPITIIIQSTPIDIISVGVTLLSSLSLTLPFNPLPVSDTEFNITTILEQDFNSVGSLVYVTASALLADGYSLPITYDDGLTLESLNQSVITVSSDGRSLQLIGAGQGELVLGRWISPCTFETLAEGTGVSVVTVPEPVGIEIEATSLKLTYTGDYAALAGVPTSTNVTITLIYPDEESRNIVSDSMLNVTLVPPTNGFVSVNKTENELIISLTGDQVFGSLLLLADYSDGHFIAELQLTSVGYSSLALYATPYPSYNNSNTEYITLLHRIYPTNQYQQASLNMDIVLTDNSTYSVTDSPLTSFSTLSAIVTPNIAGVISIEGRFGSLSDIATLNITVTDISVVIESINEVSVGLDTLMGLSGETMAQLVVSVTFNDSTQYPSFIPDSTKQLEGVIDLLASVNAIKVDSTGKITLLDNHYDLVTISVSAAGSDVTSTVSFACNLEPDVGDVDLGFEEGVPIPSVSSGSEFSVPLRVNVGNSLLSKFEISLLFDSSLLEINTVISGDDWQGEIDYKENDGLGLNVLMITGSGLSLPGNIELIVLEVTALSPGVVNIQGVIETLTDTNGNVIGTEGITIIAGDMSILITATLNKRNAVSRRERREVECGVDPLGDVDNNCVFEDDDIQYLLSYLLDQALISISSGSLPDLLQPTNLDSDENAFVNPDDAYFLHKIYSNLSYFLQDLILSPASSNTGCILELNATLSNSKGQAPDLSKTAVFFDIGLPTDFSFAQQNQLDNSFFYHGSIVLSPKSIFLHGGIIQAEHVGNGVYTVSMATNLTSSDIGLSIIIVTLSDSNSVTPGRVQTFFGSPYSPYEFIYPLNINLMVFSNNVPILASDGYNPFDSIDNSISSEDCDSFLIAQFTESNYSIIVPENATGGIILVTVELSLGSLQNVLLNITSGNLNSTFSLLQNGSLVLIKPLDHEQIVGYSLTVTSSETQNQTMAMTTITITVTDVNDNFPVISPIETIIIPSNLPKGRVVLTINATDKDSSINGQLQYLITDDELALFEIDEDQGQVILNKALNITEELNYSFIIAVRDFGIPFKESQITVNVTITLIVLPLLQFTQEPYIASIIENSNIGTFVEQVSAYLSDSNTEIEISYTILTQANLPFVIDPTSGNITVFGSVDRELKDTYDVYVEAIPLNQSEIISALSFVRITVLDENDNSPIFTSESYNISVYEDTIVPIVLDLGITANDGDIGSNAVISYTLMDSFGILMINSTTAELTLLTTLDYESQSEFSILVVGSDHGSLALNTTVSVTIFTLDSNDNPPIVSVFPETAVVNESIPLGYILANILITDEDTDDVNGPVEISINNENFNISSGNMHIVVSGLLDYEMNQFYNLTVIAKDVSSSLLTSIAFFTVFVEDINDNPPYFIEDDVTYVVNESIAINTTIVNLNELVDDIDDLIAQVGFFIVEGADDSRFNIRSTGELYVYSSLDYEMTTEYLLTVLVSDIEILNLPNDTTTITIIVLDVNDNIPVIILNDTNITVSAATSIGTTVLQVKVSDSDSGSNGIVDLSLVGGNQVWRLENGELQLNKTLDVVERLIYILTVIATDRGTPPLTSSVNITVTAEPELLVFEESTYSGIITENSPVGTTIVNVTAQTSISSAITYSLSEESMLLYGSLFTVNNTSGTVATLKLIDFEEEDRYVLSVVATVYISESQSISTSVNITVDVIDINDNPPLFTIRFQDTDVPEEGNTSVYLITALEESPLNISVLVSDKDSLANSKIEFQILDTADAFLFSLDSTTDDSTNIISNQNLDGEIQMAYNITLLAINNGSMSTLTSTAMILITISDINDNKPIFSESSYNVTITAPIPVNTGIIQVNATDVDTALNGMISYRFMDPSSIFGIDESTGLISNTEIVLTEGEHILIVVATDLSVEFPMSATVMVSITVEELTVGREQDFVITPDFGLGLVGSFESVNQTAYSQEYGFVLGNDISQPQNVSVELGSIVGSANIRASLRPAELVNCILLVEEVWVDKPVIKVAAQVRDERNQVQTLPTSVTIVIEHTLEGRVNNTNSVDTDSGTTVVSISLPLSWFAEQANLNVFCGLDTENLQNTGSVSLRTQPNSELNTTTYVYMELPFSSIFPQEFFEIPIYARTGDVAVGTYTLQINCSEEFQMHNISVDADLWVIATRSIQTEKDILFTASLADPAATHSAGEVLLATVLASTNANEPQETAFSLTVHFLGTSNKEKVLPHVGMSKIPGTASTYLGLQQAGVVSVRSNIPLALFLYTFATDILNTAVLNGEDVRIPITVLGVLPSGDLVEITDGLECTVSPTNSLGVAENCDHVLLTGIHTQPTKEAVLTVQTDTGIEGFLLLNIWTPIFPGTLTITDSTLNLIPNWLINFDLICNQQYQRARIQAYVNFTDSEDTISNIVVTHLVSLQESNSEVLALDENTVTGVSPGQAVITATSSNLAQIIGTVTITVTNIEVEAIGLDVQIVTSLSLTPENTVVDSFTENELIVSVKQDFAFVGFQGRVLVSALFSDGSRTLLNLEDGLTLSSLDESIVVVEGDTVTAIIEGHGVFIEAEWTSEPSCGGQTISSGKGLVTIQLPEPKEIIISLSSTTLSVPDSVANEIGIPTFVEILSVNVQYEDGQTQDITDNDHTFYSLIQSQGGPVLTIADVKVVTALNDTTVGQYTLLVNSTDFPTLNVTMEIHVVDVEDIRISVQPYPKYNNSVNHNITELKQIASTGLFQQALFKVTAVLTSQDTVDVSESDSLQVIESSHDIGIDPVIFKTDDGFVIGLISASNNGSVDVVASLISINSSIPYTIAVSNVAVSITSLKIQSLSSGTFSGTLGSTVQIVVTAKFSDDTIYENLFQDIVLSNLLLFDAYPSESVSVNETSGLATLHGNSLSQAFISVSSVSQPLITDVVEFHCNLDPEIGDIDLGEATGAPVNNHSVGSDFTIPLIVNSDNATLEFLELSLTFNPSILQAVEVSKGPDWPSTGFFGYIIQDPEDTIFIGGTLDSVTGKSLHLADISFQALSVGVSHLNGTINNLLDDTGLDIGADTPRSVIAGSVLMAITNTNIEKRSLPAPLKPRQKRQQLCEDLQEAGDVDGDCVFDTRDVSFLQSYYLDMLVDEELVEELPDDRAMYLDCDLSGKIDPNDVLFMSRVAFKLYRFVDVLSISTVTEERCQLNISIVAIGLNDAPAQPESTAFLLYFTHNDPNFYHEFNNSNFTMGSVLFSSEDNVGIVMAEYSGEGTYRVLADSSFLINEVGISVIQVTFDSLGDTSDVRIAVMTQEIEEMNLYSPFNFTVTLSNEEILLQRQVVYTPLRLFNNTLTTGDCIALRDPVQFVDFIYTVSIPENTPVTQILQIQATVGHHDAYITYSIDDSSIDLYNPFPFSLDMITGVISVSGLVDYETQVDYSFIVNAMENRTFTNDSAIVEISITNVNDLSPIFEQEINETLYVPANAIIGDKIIQINSTDPDMLDPITYSIYHLSIDDVFSISNETGIITVNSDLIIHNNTQVTIGVTVSDSALSESMLFTAFIFLPSFTQDTYLSIIPEDIQINSAIINTSLVNTFTDTFEFTFQPNYSFFAVNSGGSIIILENLDYESSHGEYYNLTLYATSEHFNLSAAIVILLTDVNDNAPQFSKSEYNINISSFVPLGYSIDVISASDADSGINAILQYSILNSEESQYFAIDSSGILYIVSSLLNAPEEFTITVVVNDSVHEAQSSLFIVLEFDELVFPVSPSYITNINTIVSGESIISFDTLDYIQFTQVFGVLTGKETTISFALSPSIKSSIILSPLPQPSTQFIVHLLHNGNTVYSHQNDLTFATQVKDSNFFTSTTPTNVSLTFTHTLGSVSVFCSPDPIYGLCKLYLTIPQEWFQADSIVQWTAQLGKELIIIDASTLLLKSSLNFDITNNSVVIQLQQGQFLPGETVVANVYGSTFNAITGFSLLLHMEPSLEVTKISYNDTYWTISNISYDGMYGILGIISTPLKMIDGTSETFLFSFHLTVPSQLITDQVFSLSATVVSLIDAVEGSVIVDLETYSKSGPVYFLNETEMHTIGYIEAITDKIVAVMPYVDQPILLNTAALSGKPVYIPVEIWVGYSSGRLSLYNGSISACESSHTDRLQTTSNCSGLILYGNESVILGKVDITYNVDGIEGVLPVKVYYPEFPMNVVISDITLHRIEYSLLGGCSSDYQETSMKVFVNFFIPGSTISNVDITTHILSHSYSSDITVAMVDKDSGTISAMQAGITEICVSDYQGNNTICENITVTNTPIHVSGLTTATVQDVYLSVIDSTQNNLLHNVTLVLDSTVRTTSNIIASLQYNDGETNLLSSSELLFQSYDPNLLSVDSNGVLTALKDGLTEISVSWIAPGNDCAFEITQVFVVEVLLRKPVNIYVTPSPLDVHKLTSPLDTSASTGISTKYSITMLLEYEDGSTEDITQSSSLTYTLSNNITFLTFDETGVAIAAADDRNGGTQLELSVSNLNITVTIDFRVVVTTSINITATPFPQYPGSSTLYISSLGPIMNTTFWQQSQLGMFLELSDDSMIDVTQVLEGNLFKASTLSGSITVTTDNNILIVTPLNGANSSGSVIVSPILPQFHGAEKSIEAVNTPIGIIGITVASLPNNTLQGTVNSDAYRLDITLHLEDTTSIPDVLSLDAIFNTLISIETSSPAIGVTSAGYLQPLLNTASQQLITVTFANIASDSISCFVNLVPEIGDIDIGRETEAALESVVVGDFISVPVFVNTGNEDLGNIEVILEYDESILNVADIFLGNHWSNGLYYFDIDEPGNVYFTLVFPNVGMNNERLHLLTVIFTATSSTPETTISATILTLGIQDIENEITLLSDSIAGNVPLSVLGISNKRNIEQERHQERERREVLASGCITFPCDCAIITSGDTNSDCDFDSGDVLFLLSYLTHNLVNFSLPVGEAIRDIAEHSSSTNFDVSLDGIVDVNDVYMLFRVLIGFVPFIEEINIIPVQSPLSDCIFSVIVTLSAESINHFVYIDISFSNETYQTEIESDEILTGILITYQKGEGLYGVLVRAIKQSDEVYLVQFNTTLITDIGISVIVQTLDINNQSDTAHTIQFFGPIPPIYNNTLLIDTKQLYVSAMNGYSPLQIVSNILQSDQCSNLPLIGSVLDLIFLSPYTASVIWELENERTGLSLSSLIYVQVTECLINQMGDVVITSCQELKNVTADSNTSASLMTLPFRFYTVRAIGPTTQTNITSGVSPEDGKDR